MHYDDDRLDLLRDRLAPLAIERGFDSLLDYYYLLKYDAGADAEWPRVMDALSVQETYFWREADQFTALATAIVPRLVERPAARSASGRSRAPPAKSRCRSRWRSKKPAGSTSRHRDSRQRRQRGALAQGARAARYGRRAFRQLPDGDAGEVLHARADREEWTVEPELSRASPRGAASTSSTRAETADRGRRRRDLLPQPLHLFLAGARPRGRDRAWRADAVAGLLVRRRRRIAAARPAPDSNCRNLEGRTCTSSHDRRPSRRQPRGHDRPRPRSWTTRRTSARW